MHSIENLSKYLVATISAFSIILYIKVDKNKILTRLMIDILFKHIDFSSCVCYVLFQNEKSCEEKV